MHRPLLEAPPPFSPPPWPPSSDYYRKLMRRHYRPPPPPPMAPPPHKTKKAAVASSAVASPQSPPPPRPKYPCFAYVIEDKCTAAGCEWSNEKCDDPKGAAAVVAAAIAADADADRAASPSQPLRALSRAPLLPPPPGTAAARVSGALLPAPVAGAEPVAGAVPRYPAPAVR